MGRRRSGQSFEEYFWSRSEVVPETGCREWKHKTSHGGYATIRFQGKSVLAHRLAAYYYGLVDSPRAPANKKEKGFVLHKCDNKKCVNPEHLFIGNYSDNQADAYTKGRRKQLCGLEHPKSQLTFEQLEIIRLALKLKINQLKIAQFLHVPHTVVNRIATGKTYK